MFRSDVMRVPAKCPDIADFGPRYVCECFSVVRRYAHTFALLMPVNNRVVSPAPPTRLDVERGLNALLLNAHAIYLETHH